MSEKGKKRVQVHLGQSGGPWNPASELLGRKNTSDGILLTLQGEHVKWEWVREPFGVWGFICLWVLLIVSLPRVLKNMQIIWLKVRKFSYLCSINHAMHHIEFSDDWKRTAAETNDAKTLEFWNKVLKTCCYFINRGIEKSKYAVFMVTGKSNLLQIDWRCKWEEANSIESTSRTCTGTHACTFMTRRVI